MESSIYQCMNEIEKDHWWFRARQEIILSLLQRWGRLNDGHRLLDLGCGTGNLLAALSQFPVVAEGMDFSDEAIRICTRRGLKVEKGQLPMELNIKERFHTILMLDVLEHIEQDRETLNKLHDLIYEDGRLLLTVPAHPWMWSSHDEAHHHVRRYTKQYLLKTFQQTGWDIEFFSPYNTLLFPLAVLVRFVKRALRKESMENQIPHPLVNKMLYSLFHAERSLLEKNVHLPCGLSFFAYLKPTTSKIILKIN